MRFWAGVSAVAGALRRRVWIDQYFYRWYPNFYILFVAPPGVVTKSTTADVSISLLRAISTIRFGPDTITWPQLVSAFANAAEAFEYKGEWITMSALTFESSEMGNLINPQDRDMMDLLITLWDGRKRPYTKETKTSGSDTVVGPWINLIACTTPAWLEGNFPEHAIGGGFTSRCVIVYSEKKENIIAYPKKRIPKGLEETGRRLISDLEHIATTLVGEYELTEEAYKWGTTWYEKLWKEELIDERLGGYRARKQTMLHKLAMVLSASRNDSMMIQVSDLSSAADMMADLEPDLPKVFGRIGKGQDVIYSERFIEFIRRRKIVPYEEAYRYLHAFFADPNQIQGVMLAAIRSGQITHQTQNGQIVALCIK